MNTPATIHTLAEIGQVANSAHAQSVLFYNDQERAINTVQAYQRDLVTFSDFLAELGATHGDLTRDPCAWAGVTHGLVAAFRQWLFSNGFAVATINRKLTAVKWYAKRAAQVGSIGADDQALIASVNGYTRKGAERAERDITRIGAKKDDWTRITRDQLNTIRQALPNTAQGRRDRVILALLANLGLRVSECIILTAESWTANAQRLAVYRPKTGTAQTFTLQGETLNAITAYSGDIMQGEKLLRASQKDGKLISGGMNRQAVFERVKKLGGLVGIDSLSPHDLRHYAITQLAERERRGEIGINDIVDFGGWKSPAMAFRYAERAKVITLAAD